MIKSELIEAMLDFPDNISVQIRGQFGDVEIQAVTEICPTETDTSENYLLIS